RPWRFVSVLGHRSFVLWRRGTRPGESAGADVRCRRLSWFTLALLAGLCLRLGVVAVTNAFPQLQPMDAQGYDERAWTLVSVWRGGRSEERRVGKEGRCGGVTGVEGETLVR